MEPQEEPAPQAARDRLKKPPNGRRPRRSEEPDPGDHQTSPGKLSHTLLSGPASNLPKAGRVQEKTQLGGGHDGGHDGVFFITADAAAFC